MAEIEAGPETNALVAERVMGIDPRATTLAEIGRAVMQGMVSNLPRKDYGVMSFNWGTPSNVEMTYSGSKLNYGEADGNDGYGLYFWEHREGQPWQPFIEAYVAKWRKPPRPYSTDIGAAFQVVEHMHASGWGLAHVMCWPLSSAGRGHNVQFYKAVYPPQYGEGRWEEGDKGQSFPLAICRAALHAVGYSPVEREAAGT